MRVCASASSVSDEERPFALTTPLFYVNADPHLGSAYTTMAVDALTRALRMSGQQPVMVTGCDEHGEKIKLSAEKNGKEPQQHCDEISGKFEDLFEKLGVNYDRYIRTTSPAHEKIVTEFIERLVQPIKRFVFPFHLVATSPYLSASQSTTHTQSMAEW